MARQYPTIALISSDNYVSYAVREILAITYQYQVTYHLQPFWGVWANIVAADYNHIPSGWWTVDIVAPNNYWEGSSMGGWHSFGDESFGHKLRDFEKDVPFSRVIYDDMGTISTSHEILEILVSPKRRYMRAYSAYMPSQGMVDWVLEVCDPVEQRQQSYRLFKKEGEPNTGIGVSDFILPNWYQIGTPYRTDFVGHFGAHPFGVAYGGRAQWVAGMGSKNPTSWEVGRNGSLTIGPALYGIEPQGEGGDPPDVLSDTEDVTLPSLRSLQKRPHVSTPAFNAPIPPPA